jgi:ribosomal protein S18 acetylase RimI-like enzyme
VEETYIDSGGDFLVGLLDDEIVAMGAFRPPTGYLTDYFDDLPKTTAEVKRMRVDPGQQRRGYGQQIYDELERRAEKRGFTDLVLDTSPDWDGRDASMRKIPSWQSDRSASSRVLNPSSWFFYRKPLGESD